MKDLSLKNYCTEINEELNVDAVPLKKILDDIVKYNMSKIDKLNIFKYLLSSGAVPIYSPNSINGHKLVEDFSSLLNMNKNDDFTSFAKKLIKLQEQLNDYSICFSYFIVK